MRRAAIVTGGGRGIGAATARLLGRSGYAVCVNYRREAEAAAAVVAEIEAAGAKALAVQADVRDEGAVARMFEEAEAALGPLAALVNNAGIAGPASRLDAADGETMQAVLDINVMGSLLCAREAIKRMSTRNGGGGGAIVNLSSGAATLGSPATYVWYAASKGAIDTFTMGLAIELASEGIRVNAVAPGLIETEIHAASGLPDRLARLGPTVPMERAGTPDEVAEAVLWLLSDAASYVNGTVVRVAGGR